MQNGPRPLSRNRRNVLDR